MNREEMLLKLSKKLSKSRYEHSIGVEYTAANMAFVLGADVEKARLAGRLHDCAKYMTGEEMIKKCNKHNLDITTAEYDNPTLLHAKLSSRYAKIKYDIADEEVLQAITWHTTGKPNMNLLEKIIFVADYIEPNRKPLKDIEIIRREAYSDIDRCIEHILCNTITYLEKNSSVIDDMSIKTYEFYKKEN